MAVYEYAASTMRIIDGDTYELCVSLGFHCHIIQRVRLRGVDTPELNGPEPEAGERARQFVEDATEGKELLIRTYKTRTGSAVMSFNRWIADVYVDDEGAWVDLSRLLLAAGHARAAGN